MSPSPICCAPTGTTLWQCALAGREPCPAAHSLAETYSVLTRLPGDARVAPVDAATLIDANFGSVVSYPNDQARMLHRVLAAKSIAGGAVYDALVALAAAHNDLPLVTRDRRAVATYEALEADVELITG